jgi:hypothetical protein
MVSMNARTRSLTAFGSIGSPLRVKVATTPPGEKKISKARRKTFVPAE